MGKRFFFLLIGIVICLLSGCRDDLESILPGIINEESAEIAMPLEAAKKWFGKNNSSPQIFLQPTSMSFRSAENGVLFFTQPSWKYYAVNENERAWETNVDLTDSVCVDFVQPENYTKFQETGAWKYRRSYSRLVVLRSKKDDQTTGCIMTVIPSEDYTSLYSDERIRFITYLNRDPDFSGIILFHQIDGTFSNGWLYESGKITKEIIEHSMGRTDEPSLTLNMLDAGYMVELKNNNASAFRSGHDTLDGGVLPEVICTAPYPSNRSSGSVNYDYIHYLENQNNGGNQEAVSWIAPDETGGGGYNPPSIFDELPSYSLIGTPFATVAKLDVKAVCELIGGKVLWNYQNIPSFKNACAVRLSYAFNNTEDNKIPYSSDKTVSGSDNNWYFYRVSDMVTYLKNTYGTPISSTTDNIKGKKGIIWQSECGWEDASGHLDIWNGTNALNHFYTECNNIYFWELF